MFASLDTRFAELVGPVSGALPLAGQIRPLYTGMNTVVFIAPLYHLDRIPGINASTDDIPAPATRLSAKFGRDDL